MAIQVRVDLLAIRHTCSIPNTVKVTENFTELREITKTSTPTFAMLKSFMDKGGKVSILTVGTQICIPGSGLIQKGSAKVSLNNSNFNFLQAIISRYKSTVNSIYDNAYKDMQKSTRTRSDKGRIENAVLQDMKSAGFRYDY